MTRYLVTGGAGFVGSHVVDALHARGDHVTVLDDFSTGSAGNLAHLADAPGVRVVEGTVTDADLVDRLVAESDACLHLASAVGVALIVERPLEALLDNVRGLDTVLGAAARHGRRLLFTSTSEVYGKNTSGALDEDTTLMLGSPFKARWSYSIAKLFGEALAHALHRESGMQVTVCRLFNTVGPRQSGAYGMVLPRFVRQALLGEDLTVHGDGSQTRCFIHVHDTVEALAALVDDPRAVGRVLNIGNPVPISIGALAERVRERAASDSRVVLVPYDEAYPAGFEELGRRHPDTTALQALTGWAPRRTLDDAIDDVIAYERAAQAAAIDDLCLRAA